MSQCIHCDQEATSGIYCATDNAVVTCVAFIRAHWDEGEIPALRETLTKDTLSILKSTAKERQAWTLHHLTQRIELAAKQSKNDPDHLRRQVVKRLLAMIEGFKQVQAYEEKTGEGAWLDWVVDHLGKLLAKNSIETRQGTQVPTP